MATEMEAVDQDRLMKFVFKAVGDFGAAMHAATVVLGDRLGLYRALGDMGSVTSVELAGRTGLSERYVREWLAAQAASGFVVHDATTNTFRMTPEQRFALTDPDGPIYLPGAFQLAVAAARAEPRIEEAFRTGGGMAWGEHDSGVFEGCERFFRPNYIGNLVNAWLPALDGVVGKLEAGARVLDIGCGHGASTILMANAYPRSTFVGIDNHQASIERARERAQAAAVEDRVSFVVGSATRLTGGPYDFVACFDCLHDMGDPAGAARHVGEVLAPDGTWMIVEPFANDDLQDNLNPVGRVYYSFSTFLCTPSSLSQEVGAALGAQAGERAIREVVTSAGFTWFRRAAETPFNLVFEARP